MNTVRSTNCERCREHLEPVWKHCPACGHEVVNKPDDWLSFPGARYCPEAFEEASYTVGRAVAEDPRYFRVFIRFILSFVGDPTQLVHFRSQLLQEFAGAAGKDHGLPVAQVHWCALSLATDRYFAEKARGYDWSLTEEEQLRSGWYELIAPAFLPGTANRKLDIKTLKAWIQQYLALHQRVEGPLPTCFHCTAKCIFQYDVSEIILEQKVKADYHATVNRKHVPASESVALFSRLLTERLIGKRSVDLAYCLAVHLIKGTEVSQSERQELSSDAQLVLAQKVRRCLVDEQASANQPQASAQKTAPGQKDLRAQVFEVIVRQALAGAPWQEICAGPMKANNITEVEVEIEVRRRKKLLGDLREADEGQ